MSSWTFPTRRGSGDGSDFTACPTGCGIVREWVYPRATPPGYAPVRAGERDYGSSGSGRKAARSCA